MSIISRPEYVKIGIEVYLENGEAALVEYLKKNFPKTYSQSESEELSFKLFCPNCGFSFSYCQNITGKLTGGLGGIVSGAYFGAQIGIAGGPLGAIAGTIPGAILGGIFGKNIGNNFDKPICPKCNTSFEIPKNIQPSKDVILKNSDDEIKEKAFYIILLAKSPEDTKKRAKEKKMKEFIASMKAKNRK
ncbi:hypothetical protein [Flavobacterium sp.]|uniref:hypothetical protein n=1 Tax=Flavobacterium sp. TaxID=239 RepID=UPI002486F35F|nr:hypothetical protein [Flavobacterium sp.]MDI1316031.1 hypothetical protein [Flavobacterium sp.]